jgi:hypothetical protein
MWVSWMGRRLRHFVTFSEVEAERSLFKKQLKAAACAEHYSYQPPNAVDEVIFQVKAERAHAVAIRVSFRRGYQILSGACPAMVHRLSIEHLSPRKHGRDDAASFAQLGHDHSNNMDGDQEKQCVEVPVMRRDKG